MGREQEGARINAPINWHRSPNLLLLNALLLSMFRMIANSPENREHDFAREAVLKVLIGTSHMQASSPSGTHPFEWRSMMKIYGVSRQGMTAWSIAAALAAGAGYSVSIPAASADESAPALNTAAGQPSSLETAQYVNKAAMTDLFEIDASKLALQKTQNKAIRQFAEMMIHDHTASTAQLTKILKQKNLEAPPKALAPDQQSKLDNLKSLSGKEFDAAYLNAQVQGHQDALQLHQDYAASGQDKELKAFALKVSKTVQMHLDHARKLNAKSDTTG